MDKILDQRRFVFERATKNTYRFMEDEDEDEFGHAAVGPLYVQKWVFDHKEPREIRVTIEVP